MILIENVHKRYMTEQGAGKWVLQNINLIIPSRQNVGLIGANGAGKSTLLRIICGADYPTRGRIERRCRVSWPLGQGGLEATLTGRQNAKFVCRVHGHKDDINERLDFINDFAGLGNAFDDPLQTYSSGMRSRLQFALSLAFNFDVHISDEVTAAGDANFKKKAADAFKNIVSQSSLIMVSHSERDLKEFCQSGILITGGNAYWFDHIDDALQAYNDGR